METETVPLRDLHNLNYSASIINEFPRWVRHTQELAAMHSMNLCHGLDVFSACRPARGEPDKDFPMCSNLLPKVEVSFDGTVGVIDSAIFVMDSLNDTFFPNSDVRHIKLRASIDKHIKLMKAWVIKCRSGMYNDLDDVVTGDG